MMIEPKEPNGDKPSSPFFDRQEDALRFTLAASSAMSAEGTPKSSSAAAKVAEEVCKASRITAEGVLNITP
jgi:hypothetical protein